MQRLLSVDCGLRGCGVASFASGNHPGWLLERAAYVKNPVASGRGATAWAAMAQAVKKWVGEYPPNYIAIEVMQSYTKELQKGDQNDLLEVNGVAGAIAGTFPLAVFTSYKPGDWKGQIPKKIMLPRISGKLSHQETEWIVMPLAEGLHHNVWDAIGIGLKFAGRLSSHRSI